jgi:hypothetical protein
MSEIINDFTSGSLSITETYDVSATQSDPNATPYLYATPSTSTYETVSFINLLRVEDLSSFTYSVSGVTETRTVETHFRLSRNGTTWSEWFVLDSDFSNFPAWDPMSVMWLDIRFTRTGTKTDGSIRILSYEIGGELLRTLSDGTATIDPGNTTIIKPPYVYKVFKITDLEIISSDPSSDYEIEWRFTQDSTRTWSRWEPFTKENVTTKRINPIRFFEVEYKVTNVSGSTIRINDINLIGDYQNVSLDSQKTNLFGIRECCQSFLLANSANSSNAGAVDENGVFIANTSGYLDGQTCPDDSVFNPMTAEEKATLFNPYQQTQAVNLLNKLSNDATEVFGHKTQYFVTDPDTKGIDYTLHEYGTFNIVCEGEMKVSVDNNQFPDNQITMNQFDLMMFDSFEVHITKDQFKALFGVQRRPSKEDLVYFCDLNRLFIVDHAQQHRNFNNYAVYYKVVLKKYNKSANVLSDNTTIEDRINQLTKNSTIDELFGVENEEDKKAVANKDQQQPLTKDPIRVELSDVVGINEIIIRELIENSSTVISKQHYDFGMALNLGVELGVSNIVNYKNLSPVIRKGDNIGYFMWFNLNNYIPGENTNLFNYYDRVNSLGWSSNLDGDVITVQLNSDSYEWSLPGTLSEDVWYCYLVNIDQRQRTMEQFIYKRDVDDDEEDQAKYLGSTKLRKVYYDSMDIVPVEYELENVTANIIVSDIKATNIRLFNDVIPEDQHNILLNQYKVGEESKYLIFADNASMRLTLPNYSMKTTSFD